MDSRFDSQFEIIENEDREADLDMLFHYRNGDARITLTNKARSMSGLVQSVGGELPYSAKVSQTDAHAKWLDGLRAKNPSIAGMSDAQVEDWYRAQDMF